MKSDDILIPKSSRTPCEVILGSRVFSVHVVTRAVPYTPISWAAEAGRVREFERIASYAL